MPRIREHFGDEGFYFQRDGAPPHYHRDVRAYLTKICRTDRLGEEIALNSPHVHHHHLYLNCWILSAIKTGVNRMNSMYSIKKKKQRTIL